MSLLYGASPYRAMTAFFTETMTGLYIHIPFCIRKCRYCDFVSYCTGDREAYLDALIGEMHLYRGYEIGTVFIGGGTPTVLETRQLEMLCGEVFENFNIAGGYEFTIEANPGTIDREKAAALLSFGVNRISIGVQSFNDSELKAIGRIHDAKTAVRAVNDVCSAGFENISIDLMTALPDQTMASLMRSLKTAAALPLSHISAYSLIIEDGTPMADDYEKGLLALPDEDEDREMYAAAKTFLEQRGFLQYEISNFAKQKKECRHNINYWECGQYIGIGAAAHSYIGSVRSSNTDRLNEYLKKEYQTGERTILTREDEISEFIIMGMRMNRGIGEAEFADKFGINIWDRYGAELEKFCRGGFILCADGRISFTDKGRDVSNSILCEFC